MAVAKATAGIHIAIGQYSATDEAQSQQNAN